MKIKEIKQHNKFSLLVITSLITADIFSYIFSYYIVLNLLDLESIVKYPVLIILGIIFLFHFFKRYNPSSLQSRLSESKIILLLTLSSTFIYLVYKIAFQLITAAQLQNMVFLSLIFLIIDIFVRLIIRTIQKQLLKIDIGLRNTIIIGSEKTALNFLNIINNQKYSGFRIVGYFYSDKIFNKKKYINKFRINSCTVGSFKEAKSFIEKNKVHEVIIALESKESNNAINLISDLRNMDVCIKVVPDMYDLLSGLAQMHSVTGMPLIDINPNILTELQVLLKRLIDIFVSFFALIITSPVFLLVAIIIKLSSNGHIIFKQERIGLKGKKFIVHKFRTMYTDSEKDTGPVWAKQNDPRITSVGYFLRKTRIDEFPQLFDVLIGKMSIVGPRPEREFFISQLKEKFPYYMRRLNVRPGITGWAQIMGSYDTDIDNVENKLKLDFYYIENISIWLDIKIMIITIWVILLGKGQ